MLNWKGRNKRCENDLKKDMRRTTRAILCPRMNELKYEKYFVAGN